MDSSSKLKLAIRYDGLDADSHKVDLCLLGESFQGIGRIVNTVSHFVITQQYIQKNHLFVIRMYAEEIKANCVTVHALLEYVKQYDLLAGCVGAGLLQLISAGINYIFTKCSKADGKMSLFEQQFINKFSEFNQLNKENSEKLQETLNSMAFNLRPSAKKAVQPIGKTCSTLKIGEVGNYCTFIDLAMKEGIMNDNVDHITEAITIIVRIDELDLTKASCKIFIQGDSEKRYKGVITDPVLKIPENIYSLSMARQEFIKVKAKAAIKNGLIIKYFIFNTEK